MNELFHPDELQVQVVPSYSFSQEIIITNIMKLYDIDRFYIDVCYSKGNFYKHDIPEPVFKYDIEPKTKDTIKCDSRKLPHENDSAKSIMFDPPFLTVFQKKGESVIKDRFGFYNTLEELYSMYCDSLSEFYRVLKPGGIVVFKCMDFVCSGKQNWSHVHVFNMASIIGFYPLDFFICLSKTVMLNKSLKFTQRHARKYHSYFWVFKKNKQKA